MQGAGGHASSGTTMPPSFVAVAARGEWSIGKVLDIYFKFGLGGDQYLGRILAFLDTNSPKFSALPPHWIDPSSENVMAGLHMTFKHMMDPKHVDSDHDPTGLLKLLLASIVWHSDWLDKKRAADPQHPFAGIPILNDSELLAALKLEVTIEPNDDVNTPSGVPPHIEHARAIADVLEVCTAVKETVMDFSNKLDTSIASAIDKKVAAEGGVNLALLTDRLSKLKDDLVGEMKAYTGAAATEETIATIDPSVAVGDKFLYNKFLWDIPKSFVFPRSLKRWDGWRMWLKGFVFVMGSGKRCKIRPFRFLENKDFESNRNKDDFKMYWRPIYEKMMEAPQLKLTKDPELITDDLLKESYNHATKYLMSQFSFLFEKENSIWTISTWSRKIGRSFVLTHVNVSDIAKLPPRSKRNVKHFHRQTALPFERRGVNKIAKAGSRKRDWEYTV